MKINKSNSLQKLAFKGHQHEKTDEGSEAYRFNCIYDKNKYNCEVQFFKVGKDGKNNFFIERGCDNTMEPFFTANVEKDGVQVDADYDLELAKNEPFAYRFVLKPKDENDKEYKYPQADGILLDGCSLVTRRGTSVTKQGPMILAIADTFAPGYVYAGFNEADTGKIKGNETPAEKKDTADMVREFNRSFSNTVGGTMAGIEKKVPELRKAGFKRIITCPLKGGDNASSHKYWNENNFLIAGGLGNLNNYNSLQREAFRYGMNLVDDGTFTSEGLQGVHFQRAIKWMDPDNKPDEYYMFRMSGLQDDTLGLGVIPEYAENVRLKIVNAPHDYEKQADGQYKIVENKDYDANQPTFIQVYDDKFVSDEQRNDKKNLINKYDKVSDNKLSANTHNDTPVPYKFEVNPYELDRNITSLNEVNAMRGSSKRIDLDSSAGAMFMGSLSAIKIAPKEEGGFVCWDANTDMVKFNYFTSNYDDELLASEKDPAKRAIEMDKYRRANYQVQDMTLAAGRYWTKQVRNTHNEYVAKTIGKISNNAGKAYDRIESILNSQNPDKPVLPEDVRVSKAVVENVVNGNYIMRPKHEKYSDLVVSAIMDLPLDSLEFANDVAGALSSPYISKRAVDKEHLGQTRFDAMNDDTFKVPTKYAKTYNKMNEVYTNEIKSFADKVLMEVNANSDEKLFENNKVTEYGKYVIPMVAGDIAKYALIKSLMPSVGAKQIEGGEIAYDYDKMRTKGTLKNLGINGDSQADEANQVINKIKKGVNKLDSKDIEFVAKSINTRIQNTNANSFKLAEVMVDRSGLGLDWRLDAFKDVADMDAVRNFDQTFDTAWKNVVDFSGHFVDVVKEENPNSYIVAEITDVGDLVKNQPANKSNIIYDSEKKAMNDLFNVAGINSEANYSYFFDSITNMFAYDFTHGGDNVGNNDSGRVGKLDDALNRFIKNPLDYQRNSYVFASNHDKPRMIHFMSMDMSVYHSDLTPKPQNHRAREIAYMITQDKMDVPNEEKGNIHNNPDMFSNISGKSVANGMLLRGSIGGINEKFKQEELKKVNDSSRPEHEKQAERDRIIEKYNKIYAAFSGAVADVVNGKYYRTEDETDKSNLTPDSIKKINEKEGFGSKPIPTAFDIVYDQAVYANNLDELLSGDEKEKYKSEVYLKATEIGRAKARIIERYQSALCGNPTIYAGDEGLAMTGAEDKCQNTYLQNRNPLDWSLVDKNSPYYNEAVANYKDSIFNITKVRLDDIGNKMEALNNGIMTKLVRQNRYIDTKDKTDNKQCLATVYQAANGAMNISVFNPNGVSTDPNIHIDNLKPNSFNLEGGINLQHECQNGITEPVRITPGTVFKNVNDESVTYKVYENNGNYYIKEDGDKPIRLNEQTAPDGVMMLYHIPEDIANARAELVKTKTREYYNKQHNIPPTNAYPPADNDTQGGSLNITSK